MFAWPLLLPELRGGLLGAAPIFLRDRQRQSGPECRGQRPPGTPNPSFRPEPPAEPAL